MATRDDDIEAAEYVLGLLDGPGAARLDARIKEDAGLRLEVAFWEERLASTLLGTKPVERSSEVLQRVERTLFGAAEVAASNWGPFPWKRFIVALVVVKLTLVTAWYVTQPVRMAPETRPAEVPGRGLGD